MFEMREPEKWIWTDADFDRMGWHDCVIHAFAFQPERYELLIDLDYIFEWIQPKPDETHYQFWIAPATLRFENAYDISFDLETCGGLSLSSLKRDNPRRPRNADYIGHEEEWEWTLDTNEGQITLQSVGYKQFIRARPRLMPAQSLDLGERGGFSFAQELGVSV